MALLLIAEGVWARQACAQVNDREARVMAAAALHLLESLHRDEIPPLPVGTVRLDERILTKKRIVPEALGRPISVYLLEGRRDSTVTSQLVKLIPGALPVAADGVTCDGAPPRRVCILEGGAVAHVSMGEPSFFGNGSIEILVQVQWLNPRVKPGVPIARYSVVLMERDGQLKVVSVRTLSIT